VPALSYLQQVSSRMRVPSSDRGM